MKIHTIALIGLLLISVPLAHEVDEGVQQPYEQKYTHKDKIIRDRRSIPRIGDFNVSRNT